MLCRPVKGKGKKNEKREFSDRPHCTCTLRSSGCSSSGSSGPSGPRTVAANKHHVQQDTTRPNVSDLAIVLLLPRGRASGPPARCRPGSHRRLGVAVEKVALAVPKVADLDSRRAVLPWCNKASRASGPCGKRRRVAVSNADELLEKYLASFSGILPFFWMREELAARGVLHQNPRGLPEGRRP